MLDFLTIGPKYMWSACRVAAAAIDQYLLLHLPSAANPLAVTVAVGCWNREMDGETLDRFMALAAYHADCIRHAQMNRPSPGVHH